MIKKTLRDIIFVIISSAIASVGLFYFVYPSSFAPTGVDGIATMLQKLTNVNAGIYTFAINLPLLIFAFIFLNKKFAVYTALSTATLSVFIMILEAVSFPQYASSEKTQILPAIFSGVLIGLRTGLMLKAGGSSGGVDIIAAIIQKRNPYVNIEKYITFFCYVVIGISFFVYDNNLECILYSIIQMFVFEKTIASVMRSRRNAVEFKIITSNPDALKKDILSVLKHGATVVECRGMFTDNQKKMVFCVVNIRQVPEFMKILKAYDDIFVYSTNVASVNGNFRWNKEDIAK